MKKAIICDLDKTLALLNRDPFDTDKCHTDEVNHPIKNIVNNFHDNGYDILILSGRKNKYKEKSITWLNNNNINYTCIYLRDDKDYRPDDVLKKEIYMKHIEDNWDIEFILDDRDKVVKMWRTELNLTCLQVNYGDF
tara:strand:+ start:3781 stop:4191 length:411 start_codon:yes stop_codon:yes gene_type:complete